MIKENEGRLDTFVEDLKHLMIKHRIANIKPTTLDAVIGVTKDYGDFNFKDFTLTDALIK